ncbi:MAG: hypothetical protein EOP84_26030 [Verrucomicrobiaceae bacterium]|nr:MAG: hypothetical protein EOP84_26030 [Verrucomicrobiaceae bacterium]
MSLASGEELEPSKASLNPWDSLPAGPITAFRLRGEYDYRTPVSRPGVLRSSQILDSLTATNEQEERIRRVLSAPDTYGDDPMRCFIPRFGFSIGFGPGTVDLLICLECHWVYFFCEEARTAVPLSEEGRKYLVQLHHELFPGFEPEPYNLKH